VKKKSSGRQKPGIRALEKAAARKKAGTYELKLFITGSTPRSLEAVRQLKEICETQLRGRYTLEVIDVHQQPHLAEAEQIIALPTLLKKLPLPLRRILGSFSDQDRLLAVLGLAGKKP
jgi:circadian clock protein KaiB